MYSKYVQYSSKRFFSALYMKYDDMSTGNAINIEIMMIPEYTAFSLCKIHTVAIRKIIPVIESIRSVLEKSYPCVSKNRSLLFFFCTVFLHFSSLHFNLTPFLSKYPWKYFGNAYRCGLLP